MPSMCFIEVAVIKDRALLPVFQELQVSAGVEGNINILFSFL